MSDRNSNVSGWRRRVPAKLVVGLVATVSAVASVAGTAWSQSYVAGVQPDRRPETAPRVGRVVRDARWYEAATAGVSKPHPPSLRFLDDQGGWYTPFTVPGMPGPYDIRGLHRK